MSEPDFISICPLQKEDIKFSCSLVEAAGWNQLPSDWERLLEVEPNGCFLIECEGRPAGTATTTTYSNELGWIGMVLVHPDFRRRGLATALLKRCLTYLLDEKKVDCVKLDATPDGMKVYEKLGFQAEFELARWSTSGVKGKASSGFSPSRDLPLDKDKVAFGVDRSDYLRRLISDSSGVTITEEGLGMLRHGRSASYLGPVITASPDLARAMISELLFSAPPEPVYWDILEENRDAIALAESLGFQRQRKLIRMWTGSRNTAGRPDWQWAIGGPETG